MKPATETDGPPAASVAANWRLVLWAGFVLLLGGLGYAARAGLLGDEARRPDRDVLYRWDTAAGQLVQYLFFLGIVVAISGASRRRLALRRPRSWRHAAAIAAVVLGVIYGVGLLLEPILHGGEEQGLTPKHWEPQHTWPFIANFVLIAALAPFVEELLFRGLGFHLLERFGHAVAIVVVGLAFGFYHGLVNAFPILATFGMGLAYVRARTNSVYPGMVAHALFNAFALIVSVTFGS